MEHHATARVPAHRLGGVASTRGCDANEGPPAARARDGALCEGANRAELLACRLATASARRRLAELPHVEERRRRARRAAGVGGGGAGGRGGGRGRARRGRRRAGDGERGQRAAPDGVCGGGGGSWVGVKADVRDGGGGGGGGGLGASSIGSSSSDSSISSSLCVWMARHEDVLGRRRDARGCWRHAGRQAASDRQESPVAAALWRWRAWTSGGGRCGIGWRRIGGGAAAL